MTAPRRIAGLDGLRAVAVLLVIATHAGLDGVLPGGFGVTLFFFISGWLITGQLVTEQRERGRIDVGGFYRRRALRLLPAAMAYCAVAGGCYLAVGGRIPPAGWLAALFYGANYYDLFARYQTTLAGVRHPFNILWSLAIEEHCYMVWPLLLGVALARRRALHGVAALCLAALVWRAWLHGAEAGHPAAWISERLYKGTDTRLDSIAWGAVAALLATAPWYRRIQAAPASVALCMATLLATLLIRDPWFRDVPRYSLQGAALCGLVPGLLARDGAVRRALELPPLVLIGRLSYSLYLWHWLAFGIADRLWPASRAMWLTTALALSALLSLASYTAIERPMLALRRRAGSHAPLGLLDRPGQFPAASAKKGFA